MLKNVQLFTRASNKILLLLTLILCLLVLLIVIAVIALMLGTPRLTLEGVWPVLISSDGNAQSTQVHLVVRELRLPRFLLGMLAGGALALAGVILQGTMRNDLAGPELIGVSSGASVVIASIVVWNLQIPFVLHPWLALLGGLLGGGITLFATRRAPTPARMALIGASITALCNALIIAMVSIGASQQTNLIFVYLLGSLANRTWSYIWLVLPWLAICFPLILWSARPLNLLQLGDDIAEGLGLKVYRVRLLLLMLGIILVAIVVAACGPIGYIALLAPHLARRLLHTHDVRLLLPLAAWLGAVLLTAADLLAREVLAPIELPVGAWTTLLGGPGLLVLLHIRAQRRS